MRTAHPRECNTQNNKWEAWKRNWIRWNRAQLNMTQMANFYFQLLADFPLWNCWHFKLFVNKIPWRLRQRSGFLFHSLCLFVFRLYQHMYVLCIFSPCTDTIRINCFLFLTFKQVHTFYHKYEIQIFVMHFSFIVFFLILASHLFILIMRFIQYYLLLLCLSCVSHWKMIHNPTVTSLQVSFSHTIRHHKYTFILTF